MLQIECKPVTPLNLRCQGSIGGKSFIILLKANKMINLVHAICAVPWVVLINLTCLCLQSLHYLYLCMSPIRRSPEVPHVTAHLKSPMSCTSSSPAHNHRPFLMRSVTLAMDIDGSLLEASCSVSSSWWMTLRGSGGN